MIQRFHPGQVDSSGSTSGSASGSPGSNTVVVVEDERHTRMAMQRFLQREGWSCIGFGSAADARQWLDSGNGSGEPAGRTIVGAIVDVHLPDGDGIDLTQALRQCLGQSIPIVIVSGDTSMDTLRRLQDAGADRFVGKPMSLDALREALTGGPAEPEAN